MAGDPELKKSQQRLICRCYLNPGYDTGFPNAQTSLAVWNYQTFRSPGHPWAFNIPLAADGILGPQTNARLNPPLIKQGFQGRWVHLCQEILTFLALHPGGNPAWNPHGIDGQFGPKTDAAVRAFQGDHTEPPAPKGNGKQLVKDGIVGPITWCALRS
jgi:peptidoglycan hydrolase-like protein with peptidoglycan-binding domain